MKRVINSSSFKKISALDFCIELFNAMKQMMPKNCYPRFEHRKGEGISFEHVPSENMLRNRLMKALNELGYDAYTVDNGDFNIAAVNDSDAYVKLHVFADHGEGYIGIDADNGHASIEDWYEDLLQSVNSNTEMPAGFLKTSRFTAPSITTDEQRNALEALELAISQKYKQFDSMLDRQMYLTSDTAWTGTIDVYDEGYYIDLLATRASFAAFVQGDKVIRKPRNLSPMRGWFSVEGNAGTVYYMSKIRTK